MTRTKSSRALVSVVLAVLMAVAFMPAISYTSFAATAKKATKVTKVYHKANTTYTRTVGSAWTLKYKLSPSKLTTAAKKVVWKSSNKSVVSVSAKSGNKAAVSFKKAGTATVTVYTRANKKAKTSWKFKVVNAASKTTTLTGVTVSAPNAKDPSSEVKVGTTLKANVAPEDAAGVTYQWYADGTAIEGATKASFTVTAAQAGKKISVKAKSKNEVTSAETVAVTTPSITVLTLNSKNSTTGEFTGTDLDNAKVGDSFKLVATTTGADLASVADIQWYRVTTTTNQNGTTSENETAIAGATSDTYTITKEDVGAKIEAKVTPKAGVTSTVTGKDTKGVYTFTITSVSGGVNVAVKAGTTTVSDSATNPVTTGTVKAGTALTAAVTPADANVTYTWQKQATDGSWTNVATTADYTPAKTGTYRVIVKVTSSEKVYSGEAEVNVTVTDADPLSSVKIANRDSASGNSVGDTLAVTEAMVGSLNKATSNDVHYQWYRVAAGSKTETVISNQTGQTYTLTADDAGATVYVKATYKNSSAVKSNEIKDIKNTVTAPTLANSNAKLTLTTTAGETGTIAWYVTTKALDDDAVTATALNVTDSTKELTVDKTYAGETIFAVFTGTGDFGGKKASTKAFKVNVDGTGNVTLTEAPIPSGVDLTKISGVK